MTVPRGNGGLPADGTLQQRIPVPYPHRVLDLATRADVDPPEERLGDLEAAALLRAFAAGNASLISAQDRLNAACDAAVETFRMAQLAVDAVLRYQAIGLAGLARDAADTVARRHAQDGPEDRRRRSMWRWLVWVTVALAGLFDTTFVGNLVQRILGVGPGSLMYYLAYLPGVGMALCLLAAGTVLGEHLFRRRSRINRRGTRGRLTPWLALRRLVWDWRPDPQTREPDEPPLPRLLGPVVFTTLIVGLLGVGAYVRAALAGQSFVRLASLQPVFVVLLLLLSISAIAVKAMSHNPYADSATHASRLVERATRESTALVELARESVSRHTRTWIRLTATTASAEGNARRVVEQACARILEDRWHRGAGGPLQLPLAVPRWPREADASNPASALPVLEFELLDYARGIARRYHPEQLERTLADAVGGLHAQFERRPG
jgi:hypothetical protein